MKSLAAILVELNKPLILEETDILKATMSSTDAADLTISYLLIT